MTEKRTKPDLPPDIERELPSFEILDRSAYEQLAIAAHRRGDPMSWAEARLLHIRGQFPDAEHVQTGTHVREVHLRYLAYQRLLLDDLDSGEPALEEAAEKEIQRIAAWRGTLPIDRVKGGDA